jgi:hypothetical protein
VGVVFQTAETVVDGTPAYRVSANAKTLKGLKMLYDLDDTYTTWLEHGSLRPLRFSSRLKEAKYRYKADYVYDWTQGKVQSDYHKLSRPEGKHKVMPLSDGAGDAIAIFYNLRTDDIASFAVNQPRTMTFVMDDTVRMIKYRYAGRERRKIGRMGTFNTLKIVCSLASGADPDGQMFKDGSEFYLWLSDDRNRIPLYIESPIKVGSIVAVLTKYEGLKHPLTSKVK